MVTLKGTVYFKSNSGEEKWDETITKFKWIEFYDEVINRNISI